MVVVIAHQLAVVLKLFRAATQIHAAHHEAGCWADYSPAVAVHQLAIAAVHLFVLPHVHQLVHQLVHLLVHQLVHLHQAAASHLAIAAIHAQHAAVTACETSLVVCEPNWLHAEHAALQAVVAKSLHAIAAEHPPAVDVATKLFDNEASQIEMRRCSLSVDHLRFFFCT